MVLSFGEADMRNAMLHDVGCLIRLTSSPLYNLTYLLEIRSNHLAWSHSLNRVEGWQSGNRLAYTPTTSLPEYRNTRAIHCEAG